MAGRGGGFANGGVGSANPKKRAFNSNGIHNHNSSSGHATQDRTQQLRSAAQKLAKERASLPIASAREKLIGLIRQNETVILIGETGSGKTTQLPQYLLDDAPELLTTTISNNNNNNHNTGSKQQQQPQHGESLLIAVSQPRRVAAVTVARRVASERGCHVGGEVGYAVRFEDATTRSTRIKYATDGTLLREALLDDGLLSRYGVVIVDEAHERSVATDVLLGVLKQAQERRRRRDKNRLRIVVMSATLDADAFQKYLPGAALAYVQGRQYPVEVLYTSSPEPDYLDATLVAVLQAHLDAGKEPGDILAFLTGQEEIDALARLLARRAALMPDTALRLQVTPIYAAMSPERQLAVFAPAPAGTRKAVLATNIAETSVTIPGVRYVIDTGLVKARAYHPKTGVESLAVVAVSKAQARQRAGRAGRDGPGRCFRLYTESSFSALAATSAPEILRCHLAGVVLQLKALGIADPLAFPLPAPPPRPALLRALELLAALGAIDATTGGLSQAGREMAGMPVEPKYRDAGRDVEWCKANSLSVRALRRAEAVYSQLTSACARSNIKLSSCGKDDTPFRRALVAGLFANAARKEPHDNVTYRSLHTGQSVRIHPSSVLFGRSSKDKAPACVVFDEVVLTTRHYIRNVTQVDPAWLPELAPQFFTRVEGRQEGRVRS
eukprot:jgi/Chlat1/3343/Chrsp23S03777